MREWSTARKAMGIILVAAVVATVVSRMTPRPHRAYYRRYPAGTAAAISRSCFIWHSGHVERTGMFFRYSPGYYVRRPGCY